MLYVADAMCSQLKQPGEDTPCFCIYTYIYRYIHTILLILTFSCYQVPEVVLFKFVSFFPHTLPW